MRPALLVKKCRFLKTRVRVFTSFIPEASNWFSSVSKLKPDIVKILQTILRSEQKLIAVITVTDSRH